MNQDRAACPTGLLLVIVLWSDVEPSQHGSRVRAHLMHLVGRDLTSPAAMRTHSNRAS